MKKKLIGIMVLMLLFCSTTLAASLPYKYIEVLDKVIARLETYQDNPSYIQLLDSFVAQLNTLKPRYTSSGNVPLMADYLISGVDNLKIKKLSIDLDDRFVTDLNDWITNNTSTSSSSSSGGSSSSSSGGSTSSTSSSGGTSISSTSSGGETVACGTNYRILVNQSCTCPSGTILANHPNGNYFACVKGDGLYWLYGNYVGCDENTGLGTRTINGCVVGDVFTYDYNNGSMGVPATSSYIGFDLSVCNKLSGIKYPSSIKTTANSFNFTCQFVSSSSSGGSSSTSSSTSSSGESSSTSSSGGTSCNGILYNGQCITDNLHWVYSSSRSTCSGTSAIGIQTRTKKADNSCYRDFNQQFKYGEELVNTFPANGVSFGSDLCLKASKAYLPDNTSKSCVNTSYRKVGGYNYSNTTYTYNNAIAYCGNGRRIPTLNEASNFFTFGGLELFKLSPGAVWTSDPATAGGGHIVRYSSGGFNNMSDDLKMGVICIKDSNATPSSSGTSSSGGSTSSSSTTSSNTSSSSSSGGGTTTMSAKEKEVRGYYTLMGRSNPDTSGVNYWTNSSLTGTALKCAIFEGAYKGGDNNVSSLYVSSCGTLKEQEVRSIYVAAGREPDYGGLKYWAANPGTGDTLKCTIRGGMKNEGEPMKSKATGLYNGLSCK